MKRTTLKKNTITGIGLAGGLVARALIRKARMKIKKGPPSQKRKILDAPSGEAVAWTLVESIISGLAILVIHRYLTHEFKA